MNQKGQVRICSRCVMDTSANDITFDSDGVCNYCREFLDRSSGILTKDPDVCQKELEILVSEIKKHGKKKPYDCIVGVSGGVDSSWVLVKAVELGLRPLAIHMDNGWNSELAQNNIANLVNILGVDLYTHVIDWNEYKALMQAFFDADVIDIELLYDNAMTAVNYQQANKYGIKHILSGSNQSTEGMKIPASWNWYKLDKRNIDSLGRRKNIKLKTFPCISTLDYLYYTFLKKVKWASILDLYQYNKFDAMNMLENLYGYKPYPYKHYESVFTRFYQGYILPKKFNVDKRRLHLSTLVVTGQLEREQAISDLKNVPYPSIDDIESDINYFLKKMSWTKKELEEYLNRQEISHSVYGSERRFYVFLLKISALFRSFR